jgi:hypothetical protein
MNRLTVRWAWLATFLCLTACGSSESTSDGGKADTGAKDSGTDAPTDTPPGSEAGTDVPMPGAEAGTDAPRDAGDGSVPGSDGPRDGAGDVPPSLPAGQALIGPAGGKLMSADGRVRIEVPPGALDRGVILSIQPTAAPAAGALGATYEIGPAGITFTVPVRVVFKPSSADIAAAGTIAGLKAATRETGGSWDELATPVTDAAAGTVRGDTLHLSVFGLLAGVCTACTAECDPAVPTCNYMNLGATSGRCAMVGRGCTKCVPSCDSDGDGYCPPNAPGDFPGGDCSDSNPDMHPGAREICGNGIDDDCNGHQDEGCRTCTADADCPSSQEACTGGVCVVCDAACTMDTCRFGAVEGQPGSGTAGRCQTFGRSCNRCVPACDTDGDGYCPGATNGDIQGGDCNDMNPAVSPAAGEVCGNMIDDDCDGAIDEGCGTCTTNADCPMQQACTGGLCLPCTGTCDAAACAAPSRCVARGNGCSACVPGCDLDGDGFCTGAGDMGGDCNDNDVTIGPMATEVCGNGKDDNCNDHVDEGCRACSKVSDCGGNEDCVAGRCQICGQCNPAECRFGVVEAMPGSGIAGRCQNVGQGCSVCVPSCDVDGDGYCPGTPPMEQPGGDCNDDMATGAGVHPGAQEICGNNIDDDCNGVIDDGCTTCAMAAACGMLQSCTSGK